MLCEGESGLGSWERDSLGLASHAEWNESELCDSAHKKRNQYKLPKPEQSQNTELAECPVRKGDRVVWEKGL